MLVKVLSPQEFANLCNVAILGGFNCKVSTRKVPREGGVSYPSYNNWSDPNNKMLI